MIKRIFLLAVTAFLCVAFCSCAGTDANVYSEEKWDEVKEIQNLNKLGTIVTEKEVYSTEDTVINYTLYVIEDYPNETISMGLDHILALHKLINGKWYRVPLKDEEMVLNRYLDCNVSPGAIYYREIDLSKYFHLPLPAGEYRILADDDIVSNNFTIE